MQQEKTLTEYCEEVLQEDIPSRKNATWFCIQVLRKMGITIYIDYRELLKRKISFESIISMRRKIQHKKGKFNEEFIPEEGITFEPRKGFGIKTKILLCL